MSLSGLFKKKDRDGASRSLVDEMIEQQILERGIDNPSLIEAMRSVPRHLFIPSKYRIHAYDDCAVYLGLGQTVSQPYIVGLMTRLLNVVDSDRILEIGTGSGYQTAILAQLAQTVYTVEQLSILSHRAQERLDSLGYDNIQYRVGDGYKGWNEKSPFDGIIVTAAPKALPNSLFRQLKENSRMVFRLTKSSVQ